MFTRFSSFKSEKKIPYRFACPSALFSCQTIRLSSSRFFVSNKDSGGDGVSLLGFHLGYKVAA